MAQYIPHGQAGLNQGAKEDRKITSERQLKQELAANGYDSVAAIEDKLEAKGKGVFKASGQGKPAVALRVYAITAACDLNAICEEVLELSSLHHPHIVQPKSLIRTPNFLCIALEYANGGDVFRLARRAGADGLPVPAARFIFQQLILTLQFAHDFGIFLCHINPSNVLVFWNDRGMPILKIADFRLSRPAHAAEGTQVIGTMYSCPQIIRLPEVPPVDDDKLARAADVWAACVTLYFLLYARWPFEKKQIAAWATTPRELWKDNKFVEYPSSQPGTTKEGLGEVEGFLGKVFACGGLTQSELVAQCSTLADIAGMAWFKLDLPAGAANMRETYTQKTRERRASEAYSKLKELLENAVSASVTSLTAKMQATTLDDSAKA